MVIKCLAGVGLSAIVAPLVGAAWLGITWLRSRDERAAIKHMNELKIRAYVSKKRCASCGRSPEVWEDPFTPWDSDEPICEQCLDE
ncbi:MAG: hypothetical protein ACYTEQ_22695 [Planctomycetota bacterium]|jgi:hypothetical protein